MKSKTMASSQHGGRRFLLCVDLSYQVYRASAAHPMLTCRDMFTGGLYGFLMTLAKTIRETHATHIVFCQDQKPYLRSRDYPEYKQLRKKNVDDELLKRHKESMGYVLKLLGELGLPVWGLPGFESDDLIAHAVKKYRHRFTRICAATNDSDLFQWLWVPNFYVYTKDATNVIAEDDLLRTTGLTPAEFMLATALQGTHNDIAGIPNVGPKTATKAVKDASLLRKYRESHGDVIDRNLALIQLPHPEFPGITSLPEYRGGFNQRDFVRALSFYDIDVTMSMINAFEQLEPKD